MIEEIYQMREAMPASSKHCVETLTMAAVFGLCVSLLPAHAAGDLFPSPSDASPSNPVAAPPPPPPPAPAKPSTAAKPLAPLPSAPPASNKDGAGKASQKKQGQRSELDYQNYFAGYQAARALVLEGKYTEAITAFRALGHDDSPEVANYLGYSYRKLGNYDGAKVWYDKALVADPNHVRTWQYYGLWHLEQGNKLKAQDFLEKIRLLCGNTTCQEYVDLSNAIEHGVHSY
jgi:tetratricopeptide (TPR) repeat protein